MQETIGDGFSPLTRPEKAIQCSAACPLNIDVAAATLLAAKGRKAEARHSLLENNPMPLSLSYLCHAPCGSVCDEVKPCNSAFTRDILIAVPAAKDDRHAEVKHNRRPACNEKYNEDPRLSPEIYTDAAEERAPRVAIVGSSPTALSAAYFLARAGCAAEIFEEEDCVGGWLVNSIESINLPEEAFREDLRRIQEAGVKFHVLFGDEKRRLIENHRGEGFDALLIVPSAFDPARSEALGDGRCAGIADMCAFLRASLSSRKNFPEKIALAGSSGEALAAALLCARHGGKEATVFLHESEAYQCAATSVEIETARSEGVNVVLADCFGISARRNGRLLEISAAPQCSSLKADVMIIDNSLRPVSGEDGEIVFIAARRSAMALDADSMVTEKPGVFCAEPAAHESGGLAAELARGRRAADNVHRYLKNSGLPGSAATERPELEDAADSPCGRCLMHLAIHRDVCNGCLQCVEACPSGALYAANEKGVPLRHPWPSGAQAEKPRPALDAHLCAKCGACSRACPQGALEIRTFASGTVRFAETGVRPLPAPDKSGASLASDPLTCALRLGQSPPSGKSGEKKPLAEVRRA